MAAPTADIDIDDSRSGRPVSPCAAVVLVIREGEGSEIDGVELVTFPYLSGDQKALVLTPNA